MKEKLRHIALQAIGLSIFAAIIDVFDITEVFAISELLFLVALFLIGLHGILWVLEKESTWRFRKYTIAVILCFIAFISYPLLRQILFSEVMLSNPLTWLFAGKYTGYLRKFTLTFIIAVYPRRENEQRRLLLYTLAGIAVVTVLTLVDTANRATVQGVNPNQVGFTITLGALLVLYLYFERQFGYKFLQLCLTLFMFAILSTGSRGSYIVLFAACVSTLFLFLGDIEWNSVETKQLIAYSSTVSAGIFGYLILSGRLNYYVIRIISPIQYLLFGESTGFASTKVRVKIIKGGLNMFAERPLFGIGPGSFNGYLATHPPLFLPNAPHNTYILILAELGIIGIFLLGLFFVSISRILGHGLTDPSDPKTNRQFKILATIFVAILVQGLFIDVFIWKITWVFFGLMIGLYEVQYCARRSGTISESRQ